MSRRGSPASLSKAFQVFQEMELAGIQPNAVSYGSLLTACRKLGDVDRASALYRRICDRGVLPNDECHNILINIYADAGRVDEALDLFKKLARKHGEMQEATLNSVVRALTERYADRALRMLSLMRTLGMRPYHQTLTALIGSAARASRVLEAKRLYRELREQGLEPTRGSGSDLIVALCRANEPALALRVYEDMTAASLASLAPKRSPETGPQLSASARASPSQKGSGSGASPLDTLGVLPRAVLQTPAVQSQDLPAPASVASPAEGPGTEEAVGFRTAKAVASGTAAEPGQGNQCGQSEGGTSKSRGGTRSKRASLTAQEPPGDAEQVAPGGSSHPFPLTGKSSKVQTHRDSSEVQTRGSASEAQTRGDSSEAQTLGDSSKVQSRGGASEVRTRRDSYEAQGEASKAGSRRESSTSQRGDAPTAAVLAAASPNLAGKQALPGPNARGDHAWGDQAVPGTPRAPPGGTWSGTPLPVSTSHAAPAGDERTAAASGGRRRERLRTLRNINRRAVVPHAVAVAELVHALASRGDLPRAFHLYQQLKQEPSGADGNLTLTARHMYQALIESACRQGKTILALQVFDDWKADVAKVCQLAGRAAEPRLSTVTLAFLEASCRADPAFEWRVYDVCAAMRQQEERKRAATLPTPAKESHHVLDSEFRMRQQEAAKQLPSSESNKPARTPLLSSRLSSLRERSSKRGRLPT
eukprot:jgi/Botrbrau1/16798/Bobra.150_2s0027.1